MKNLQQIQNRLQAEKLDGWLFFDHHIRDPIAYRVLGLDAPRHVSRRWYYWIPAQGDPRKLVHRIEDWMLDPLPGERSEYSSWQEQHRALGGILSGAKRVAMQYSPDCMIPYVSLVDAGTVDLVRGLGSEVVSSAALVQYFEARWTDEQLESHLEAGRRVDAILAAAFAEIGRRVKLEGSVEEFAVAEFIRARFRERQLVTADGPIVAVNANSGNPHYAPAEEKTSPIRNGDFVLIDLWAKLGRPHSVYYDITWTASVGGPPRSEIVNVFEIVSGARHRAAAFVNQAVAADTSPSLVSRSMTSREITLQAPGSATGSSIAPAIRSAKRFTETEPTRTTSRLSTDGRSFPEPASRSSRESTCRRSACAARSIATSRRRGPDPQERCRMQS